MENMLKLPYGTDFKLKYIITTFAYSGETLVIEDYNLRELQSLEVSLYCTNHETLIPLEYDLVDGINNGIIAKVIGEQLEVGSVYQTIVVGIEETGDRWEWRSDDYFCIVEQNEDVDLGTYADLQKIGVNVGLVGLNGPQGVQGSAGRDGVDGVQGVQGSIGNQGAQGDQGEIGYQGSKGDRGITGAQGDAGAQGSRGNQGEKGDQGAKGDRGITGYQGEQGNQGNQGEQGNQGAQGERGFQGDAGIGFRLGEDNQYYVDNHVHITNGDSLTFANEEHPYEDNASGSILFASKEMGFDYPQVAINVKGLAGVEGSIVANDYHYYDEIGGSTKSIKNRINDLRTRVSTLEESGVQGPQGNKGVDGYQGRDGAQGSRGAQGEIGYQGNQGNIGIAGIQGDMGQQGSRGFQGDAGVQGSKGDRGTTGYQGDAGVQGLRGIAGAQGNQGEKGAQGSCRFEDLTPQEKESLKGAQGSQGRTGNQGEQGVQGQRGEKGYQGDAGTGAQGVKGSQGDKGDRGVIGYQGDAGTQGNMGVQGARGARGPQGYGAASPAAELPRVALWDAGIISGTGVFNVYISIADNTTVYDDLYTYFYNKFNITDTIDQDFTPTSIIISSNNNYTLEIHGDFDKMHLTIDNRQFTITKANDTQDLPTWLSISIRARASLFNLQNQISGDEVCILGMTYVNLSDADWNPLVPEP